MIDRKVGDELSLLLTYKATFRSLRHISFSHNSSDEIILFDTEIAKRKFIKRNKVSNIKKINK